MPADDIAMRDFAPADLEAVLALRAKVFGATDLPRERRRWRWEHDEHPFRRASLPDAWVLERDGAIVGNCGLVPCEVSIDGASAFSVACIDFAVDPDQQGRGLGRRFATRLMAPDSFAFPFATGTTKAGALAMKAGGGEALDAAEDLCLWVFPLGAGRPLPAADPALRVHPLMSFDARFDALNDELRRGLRLLTSRSAKYLNWRYRDYPFGRPAMWECVDAHGVLRGFTVLQHDAHVGHGYVAELYCDVHDAPAHTSLLHAALREAERRRLREVYTLQRLPVVQALLQANGFHRVEGHSLWFFCRMPVAGPKLADWYVTLGDGDCLFNVGDLAPM
jgi:GNAT superfamily N-acetyltransferase